MPASDGHNARVEWQTHTRRVQPDDVAPDGSEIFLLTQVRGASMVACRLAAGQTTRAVRHRTVEELWYCLAGRGELWRQTSDGAAEVVTLAPRVSVTIPVGTRFQFRAEVDLELIIATLPPWPGADEAVFVEGPWTPA
jgi:mannose-6-phosphate isomerase-like protein (cupin superfamily)